MKLVVIGGSAPSTPHLFAGVAQSRRAEPLEVRLVGRTLTRLRAVARASQAIAGASASSLRVEIFEQRFCERAIDGADIVLVQARIGGLEARSFDETFPLEFDIPGDEGLGPGGLSAAWRSWPALRPVFDAIERGAPDSLVVLLTSPLGILVRCIRTAYPGLRVVGICELPWTTLQDICSASAVAPADVSFTYAGINHLGSFGSVRYLERDLIAEYAATRALADSFPSAGDIERCGGVPLKYLELHYHRAASVERLKRGVPRGTRLQVLQDRAISFYESGDPSDVARGMSLRSAPWYEHAVGPLLIACGSRGGVGSVPFFLSVPNRGALLGFADDDIVELPHAVESARLVPLLDSCRVPDAFRSDLTAFVGYERLAARAVVSASVPGLVEAMSTHPWVDGPSRAAAIAAAIVRGPYAPAPATSM